ncbi:MAG: hypothetical protein WB992_17885 [Bryobacteraceae bacterium]
MKFVSLSQLISLLLTPVLVIAPLWAQLPDPQTLQLRVVERDGLQARAGSQALKGFIIEVTDSAARPLADVAVAFRLPDDGATGTFADHTHSAVAYTDSLGRAHVSAIEWSATPGLAVLRVTATKGTSHAGLLVQQTLLSSSPATVQPAAKIASPIEQPGTPASPTAALAPIPAQQPAVSVTGAPPHSAPHSGKAKWYIIAAVAAGAGVGVALATKGKSSSSTPAPPSTASIGAGTISVGH